MNSTIYPKKQPSTGKVIGDVFWDKTDLILIGLFESEQIINSDHYIMMLTKLINLISIFILLKK